MLPAGETVLPVLWRLTALRDYLPQMTLLQNQMADQDGLAVSL
jgi:hypothetical protein